jgi:mRNA interferase MazF
VVSGKFYQPDRGDFIYVDCSPQAGTEQAGNRPALILSPRNFNIATSLAFMCPLTNTMTGSSFEVPVPKGTGLTGVILSSQMRSLDWVARKAEFISRAPEELLLEVLGRIEAILAIALDPEAA